MRRKELFYYVTSGSNVMWDVHWCVTVFYQQIENGNIANQIHEFTIDYRKFILNINRATVYLGWFVAQTIYGKHTHGHKKFCSHGNSLFFSAHSLDFNILVICSSENLSIWLLDHAYEAPSANIKMKFQRWPEKPLILGRPRYHGNKTVSLELWSIFSRILLQRIKHFWYKLAEI